MRFTIRKEISSGAVLESRVERSLRGYFFLSFCNGESVTWPEIVNWRITPAIKHFYALTSVRKTTEPVVWGWPRLIPSFGRREINGSLPLPVGTTRVSVKSGRLHRINHLPHRYGTITIVSSLSRVHGSKDSPDSWNCESRKWNVIWKWLFRFYRTMT